MASKEYSVAFRINGALSGQFAAAMQAAQNIMKGLSSAAQQVNAAMAGSAGTLSRYLNSLNQMTAQSKKFADLKAAIPQTQSALTAELAKMGQLATAYRQQKAQVDAMRAAYQQLKAKQADLKKSYTDEQNKLRGLQALKQQYKRELAENEARPHNLEQIQKAVRLESQIKSTTAAIEQQRQKIREAKSVYDTLTSAMKGSSAELRAAESALKQLGSNFDSSKAKVTELMNTLRRQKSELASLKSSLSAAGFSTDHFVSSEMKLRSEIAATTAAIERQRQAAASLSAAQNNLNSASSNFSEAQSAFNSVQQAVQTVAAPIVDATQNAMTFEREMSKVKSLTQMRNIRNGDFDRVASEMAELTAEAERLGATTEFTSTEVAQAMSKYGMSGWNKDQILGVMQATLDAASIAGDHNIMRTADVLSDDMMAFGIKAGKSYKLAGGKVVDGAQYFTDAFAYAWTQANLDRESLHEAWKYNAPGAKAAGLSLGETLAQNMFVANAGIKGSMGGTSFRAGWTRFLAPPKTAKRSLEEMGMAASDATKQIMEAQAALTEAGASENDTLFDKITKAYQYYQTLDNNHKAGWLKNLVGQTALSAWQNVFDKGGIEEIARIAQEIDSGSIAGWATDTATIMRDNTATSIEYVKSAIDALQRSIGDALLPTVDAAAKALNPIITKMAQWTAENPRVVQGIVGIIAALSALALAVTGVAVAFAAWSFITAQFAMFQAGLAAVRAGMIATEVASLGMAARIGASFGVMSASVTGAFASLRAITWGGLFAGLTAQIAAARVAIMGFFASLSVGSIASSVAAALGRVGTAILGVGRAAMAFAFSPVGAALMALAFAAYVIYQNWDRLAPVFSSVGAAISAALSGASAAVGNLVSALGTVGEALLSAFKAIDNAGGGDVLIRVFLGIVNVLAGVAVSIINIFSSVVNTVAHMFDGLGKAISAAMEGEFSQAASHMKDTLSNIKGDWENIHFSKLDFGYDIGANYQKSLDTYNSARINTQATQPVQSAAESQGTLSNAAALFQPAQPAAPAPMPTPTPAETPNLDTSSFTAQMQALGTATEQPAQTLPQIGQGAEQVNQSLTNFSTAVQPAQESIAQLPQAIQPVQDAIAQFPQALLPAQEGMAAFGNAAMTAVPNVGQLGTAAQGAAPEVGQLGTTAQAAAPNVGQLGTTAQGAAPNVGQLGTAAGGAAPSVGQLGTAAQGVVGALQSAAAQISSIHITVPTITVGGAAAPAANYKGGIYDKGAFLTWFAERSPEAAIPLDKSKRAINLWTQAGQMLGVLPAESPVNVTAEKIPRDNTQRAIFAFQSAKEKKARKIYNSVVNQSATENYNTSAVQNTALSNITSTVERISNVQRRVQNLQAAQFDELGNIIGLNGAAGNVITQYDSEQVKHVKQERQLKEFAEKQDGTSSLSRYLDKFKNVIKRVRETFSSAESQPAEKIPAPTILFESQRWRSESPTRERTLDRVANSRSYQAIVNAQRQSVVNSQRNMTRQNTRMSILNAPAELQTTLPTDRYKNLNIGGFNLRDIPFVGDIFGKANDALRGIFGKQPVDIFRGIGKSVDYEIMHPRGTFPTLPAETKTQGNLPTDIFKNVGGVNFDKIPIIGGLIGKANDALRGIFGKQPVDIFSGIGKSVDYEIMHPRGTFPTLQSNSAPMLDRIQNLQSSVTDNRLEDVRTYEGGTSNDYSAAAFQPTFNITVNLSGNGEQVDTKKIGEQIAYSARESFEKEFNNFMREKSRRGFA